MHVGKIPVLDVDLLIGVDAVLNIRFDKLYNLFYKVKELEELSMILYINEVVEKK